MRVQFVNPFVTAASEVIAAETGETAARGALTIEQNPYTSDDVTAVVGMSGPLRGSVYLSMSQDTALNLVGRMLGQEVAVFDDLAESGIAELANVVAGTASITLADLGFATNISPPLMLVGSGARISTFDLQRVVVPLQSSMGVVRVHVALRAA
jgi:chemotaxis protein CheX